MFCCVFFFLGGVFGLLWLVFFFYFNGISQRILSFSVILSCYFFFLFLLVYSRLFLFFLLFFLVWSVVLVVFVLVWCLGFLCELFVCFGGCWWDGAWDLCFWVFVIGGVRFFGAVLFVMGVGVYAEPFSCWFWGVGFLFGGVRVVCVWGRWLMHWRVVLWRLGGGWCALWYFAGVFLALHVFDGGLFVLADLVVGCVWDGYRFAV